MSRIKRFSCCLALIIALALGFAPGANAQTAYTCNESGNPPPASVSGDADLTESGSCTLDYTVNATGEISINAGSDIDIVGLTAGNGVTIDGSGDLSAGDDITTSSGAVSISANSIDIEGVTASSEIDIISEADMTLGDEVSANNGPLTIEAGTTANTQGLYANNEVTVSAQTTLTANTINSSTSTVTLTSVSDTTINGSLVAGSGDLSVMVSAGNITVSGLVNTNSGGLIDLEANNVEVDADVESATAVKIVANSDSIKLTGDLYANEDDSGGNVILQAQNNVQTGSLYGVGTNSRGQIEIEANLAGGNTEFIIGGSGNTNGINGSVDVSTVDGGSTSTTGAYGGLYVVNGTAGSTGGITVSENSNINVSATNSRFGAIFLNAQSGTLTLGGGVLDAGDGSSDNSLAGFIALAAQTIQINGDSTIEAIQTTAATANYHSVSIAASSVNYSGSLTIASDGNGLAGNTAGVNLLPTGGLAFSSNEDIDSLEILFNFPNGFYNTAAPLDYAGDGALTVTSNGSDQYLVISGSEISFAGTDFTAQSDGPTDTFVCLCYNNNMDDLTFNSTGNVLLDSSGVGGNGGGVLVGVNNATITAPSSFTMTANGPSSGDGDAGTVYFSSNGWSFGSSTIGLLSANGAANGTGNGNYVTFYPGTVPDTLTLGNGSGQILVSSTGDLNGGNGGQINVTVQSGGLTAVGTAPAADASAIGDDGNGGNITLLTYAQTAINGPIHCDGHGAGSGGECNITGNTVDLTDGVITANGGTTSGSGNTVSIQSTSGSDDIVISESTSIFAQGGGDSGTPTGGSITLSSGRAITEENGADIDASALSPEGTGGSITLNSSQSTDANLTIAGTISADGGTTGGAGGQVTLSYKEPSGMSNLQIGDNGSITADSNDSTTGGSITFVNQESTGLVVNSTESKISANGGIVVFSDASQGVSVTASNTSNTNNPISGLVVSSGTSVQMSVVAEDYSTLNRLQLQSVKATSGDVSISSSNLVLAVVGQGSSSAAVSATGNTSLTGDRIEVALASTPGQDFVFGQNTTVQTNSTSDDDIVLGSDISATQTASVTVNNSGNILPGGTSPGGSVNGLVVTLSAEDGSIGTSSSISLQVQAQSTLQASNDPTSTGNVYIQNNSSSVQILSPTSSTNIAGNFYIISNGDVTLDGVQSQAGTVQVVAGNSSTLTLPSRVTVSASQGNILLGAGGSIVVGSGSTISANCPCGGLGNVYLSLNGFPGGDVNGLTPSNVTAIPGGTGEIYFNAGITANSPNNTVTALNRTVGFDVGTLGASNILLGGGVTVSAE